MIFKRAVAKLRAQDWVAITIELVIVTLGVLIALGLQQFVSDLSDRAAVSRARSDIREEIGFNLGGLQQRQQIQGCIDRRLDQIAAHLNLLAEGEVRSPPRWIGRPQSWGTIEDRWNVASHSGHAALLSADEQDTFTTIYDIMRALEEAQADEQTLWSQLRALEGQQSLENDAIFSMRSALSQARFRNWRIKLGIRQIFERTRPAGIEPISTIHLSRSVCIPIETPRAVALTMTETPYGEP